MFKTTSAATQQELTYLFEPDVLAPSQFHAIVTSTATPDPERRLMLAVLEDAVSCLLKDPRRCPGQQRKSFEEAYSWINAADGSGWVFSFTNVCESLGFDPGYLRRGLNTWAALRRSGSAMPRLKKYRSGVRQRKLRFRAQL